MRIIAGQCRGMRLTAPEGLAVRPTGDLVRGAGMSQLGGFFDGQRVLDICAGTGAVALEFLSRGCAHAVALEKDPSVAQLLRKNALHTRLSARLDVEVGDAVTLLPTLAGKQEPFDLVWFDPPYALGLHQPVLALLAELPLLAADAEVMVESRDGLDAAWLEGRWRTVTHRRYGSCVLDRLQRLGAGEAP